MSVHVQCMLILSLFDALPGTNHVHYWFGVGCTGIQNHWLYTTILKQGGNGPQEQAEWGLTLKTLLLCTVKISSYPSSCTNEGSCGEGTGEGSGAQKQQTHRADVFPCLCLGAPLIWKSV